MERIKGTERGERLKRLKKIAEAIGLRTIHLTNRPTDWALARLEDKLSALLGSNERFASYPEDYLKANGKPFEIIYAIVPNNPNNQGDPTQPVSSTI